MLWSRCAIVVVVALACACHAKRAPRTPDAEYLKAVEFEGNRKISSRSLLDGLVLHRTLKARRALDPYLVQIDGERVKSQYNREGYFEAQVEGRVEREKDATTVIYEIHEGQRARTHVTITGVPPDVALHAIRTKLPIAEGAPFDYDVYDTAKPILLGVVQDAGYAHASLDARVHGDLATHTAEVTLAFTPGPKCRFGATTIVGVTGALRDAVAARLQFSAGDTYSSAAVTATQRALYAMGRFSTVLVQPETDGGDVVAMKVAVSKTAAHQVTLGAGAGLDPASIEVRVRGGYEVTGWPSQLDRAILDLRPAYAYLRTGNGFEPRIRALGRLERQDLLFTYAVGSVEAGYDYLAYEAFTEYGPQGKVAYEVRLGTPHLRLRAGYLIHRYGFRKPSPLVDPALQHEIGIDHDELVGAYQQLLIADLRDHPLEPRLGVYGEIAVTEGTKYAGGDYKFELIAPEVRGYVPVGPVVVAARARYGAIYGDVPASMRFFSGGATSQRGFSERLLSPSVTGKVSGSTITVPYGGAGLAETSLEARFPIAHVRHMPLGGLVFLDGGDVTERPAELRLGNLQWAAGFGFRLLTLIGPARADFGYRLNRTGPDDPQPGSKFAFHLSLGEAF